MALEPLNCFNLSNMSGDFLKIIHFQKLMHYIWYHFIIILESFGTFGQVDLLNIQLSLLNEVFLRYFRHRTFEKFVLPHRKV